MSGGLTLIDIIIFIAVGIFIYTRFFGHTLPGGKPKKPGARRGQTRPTGPRTVKAQPQAARAPSPKVVPLKPTKQGVAGLREVMADFNQKDFLEGAKAAFSTYFEAWQNADEETLADLLAPSLFDEVVDELETAAAEDKKPYFEAGDKLEATLVDGRLNGRTALVEVKYKAEMLQDFIGKNASSSRKKPKTVEQVWVWARPVESDDPNWQLQAINPVS